MKQKKDLIKSVEKMMEILKATKEVSEEIEKEKAQKEEK